MAHLKRKGGHLLKQADGHLAKECCCEYVCTSAGTTYVEATLTVSGITSEDCYDALDGSFPSGSDTPPAGTFTVPGVGSGPSYVTWTREKIFNPPFQNDTLDFVSLFWTPNCSGTSAETTASEISIVRNSDCTYDVFIYTLGANNSYYFAARTPVLAPGVSFTISNQLARVGAAVTYGPTGALSLAGYMVGSGGSVTVSF